MLDHEVPGEHAQQSKLDTKIRELVFQRGQWIRRNPGKIKMILSCHCNNKVVVLTLYFIWVVCGLFLVPFGTWFPKISRSELCHTKFV